MEEAPEINRGCGEAGSGLDFVPGDFGLERPWLRSVDLLSVAVGRSLSLSWACVCSSVKGG